MRGQLHFSSSRAVRFINSEPQVDAVPDVHSKASNAAYLMLPQAGNLNVNGNETDGKKPIT